MSILDLMDNGHLQPMERRSRSVIVFNGEIYNYRELKTHLADIEINSGTDTGLFNEQGIKAQADATRAWIKEYIFTLWNIFSDDLVPALDAGMGRAC